MTAFDYVILGVILASGVLGLLRGFLKEIFSLLAYILSFLAAVWWGPRLIPMLSRYIDQAVLTVGLAYFLVFIASLLLLGLLNKTLGALLDVTGLGSADRGLGFLFGIFRGVVIVLILVLIAGWSALPQEIWWIESHFAHMAVDGLRQIKIWLPEGIAVYLPY
jgi:membrane protein required for colicin V production